MTNHAEKQHDDEMLLQTLYAFMKLLLHKSSRNLLLRTTQIVQHLLSLLFDEHMEIRRIASLALDVVSVS